MPADTTPTTPHFATSVSPRTLQTNATDNAATNSPRSQSSAVSLISGSMGGVTFEDVGRWDEKEVSVWLQSVKLSGHASAFLRNDIAGLVLFDIDVGFLKEMGISSVGDRIRITTAIKALRKRCVETDAVKRQRALLNEASEMEWIDGEQQQPSPARDSSRLTSMPSGQDSPMIGSSPLIGGRNGPTLREVRGMGNQAFRSGSGRSAAYQSSTRPSTTAGSTSQATLGSSLYDASPTNAFFTPHRPSTAEGRVGSLGGSTASESSQANSSLPSITESSAYSRASMGGMPNHQASPVMALDDVRKKTIKFIGEDGTTKVLAVADCRDAYDVLARVLRKFGKSPSGNSYKPTAGQAINPDEDLLGDPDDGEEQWGIFATSREGHTKYLTDSEVLAICHAPQYRDPLRERGLELRRISRTEDPAKRPTAKRPNKVERILGISPSQINSNASLQGPSHDSLSTHRNQGNRASTVSILTGLGVNVARSMSNSNSQGVKDSRHDNNQRSPPSLSIPQKARNFFGQRPPSELISSHLADFFPATEKRVLERTVRRSIYGRPSTSLRSKRDSTWSFAADLDAPPLPHKDYNDGGAPAILIGMDSSEGDGSQNVHAAAPILPPPRTSTDDGLRQSYYGSGASLRYPARPANHRRASGESTRSRQSLATKLRAARGIDETGSMMSKDRSDTASLLTVDEITQEVENRRESMNLAAAHSGWVVDEDGVPIPLTARNFVKSNVASSIAGSNRPGSHRSVSFSTADTESELEHRLSDEESSVGVEDITQRPTADAPGEELDRHLGDPMARLSDESDPSDGLDTDEDYMDADEDDNSSGEEGDGEGGVYQSAAPGREPIKWIKGALIGAGSFGSVFLGMNAKSGLLMAVKQVELPSSDSHSDQRKKSMLEALEREIELLKTIQHENIVQYLDSYADATHLNIFLEYVPGGSVAALLRNYGAFEEPLVRNFVKQILHGLSFLHSQDIVHRDIKGANILVDNKSCIKISDFGISKKTESGLYVQHRPSLQGSVFWMAPEVVKQTSYTRKADIWSLGCLVVEMISGTHPWANLNQMQALYQIGSHAKPAIPDEISPAAIDFLNKTFELDHLMRPSAEELLEYPFITEEYTLPTVTSPTS